MSLAGCVGQIGNFGQGHCVFVERVGLCSMEIFSRLCCKTCQMFDGEQMQFYDYYDDELYDETTTYEDEQGAENSTTSVPLASEFTSLPET